jgi:uroporphyrinogen decarboxylase
MTSKERVLRTLEFKSPDRIPYDAWILPGAFSKYGEKLTRLVEQYPLDIIPVAGPSDHGFTPEYYQRGTYTDLWGCPWVNIQPGLIGEVKDHILANDEELDKYHPPVEQFLNWWKAAEPAVHGNISLARERGRFVMGGWVSLFERMQFLRGTQELFIDIASREDAFSQRNTEKLLAIVMEFYRVYLDRWLGCDIDGVGFGDDWGSQVSTLISPTDFRDIFKPCYRELFALVKRAGKKIFFHSDGWIYDLYDDFLELGVDAINTQLWCMGIEKARGKLAGKITVWGELNRQSTMPSGTPEDVRSEARLLVDSFAVNGGGFIGLGSVLPDVPLQNVEAMFAAWNS